MTQTELRDALRSYLIDLDSVNIIIEFSEESSDTALDLYLAMALSQAYMAPPYLAAARYDVTEFPMPTLLIHLAALECLKSNGIFQARNDVQYNNSGISIKAHDGQRYNTQIQYLENTVAREMDMWQKFKIQLNCQACYGGVWSPYATLNGRRPV